MNNQSLIVRSIAEYEAEARGEHRGASRSVPRHPLGGTVLEMPFTVLQISTEGLRIRHDATLLEGQIVQLSLALPSPEPVLAMEAQVAWTNLGQHSVSGLRVFDRAPLQEVVDRLVAAGDLVPDQGDRGTSPLGDLSDREVAAILRVARRLYANGDDDIMSVWKSLVPRLDIAKVETVVTWLRQTRSTAAEAQHAP